MATRRACPCWPRSGAGAMRCSALSVPKPFQLAKLERQGGGRVSRGAACRWTRRQALQARAGGRRRTPWAVSAPVLHGGCRGEGRSAGWCQRRCAAHQSGGGCVSLPTAPLLTFWGGAGPSSLGSRLAGALFLSLSLICFSLFGLFLSLSLPLFFLLFFSLTSFCFSLLLLFRSRRMLACTPRTAFLSRARCCRHPPSPLSRPSEGETLPKKAARTTTSAAARSISKRGERNGGETGDEYV